MKLSKTTLLITVLGVLLAATAIYLGFRVFTEVNKEPEFVNRLSTQRQIDTTNYSNREYVVPLERNADTPSIYSSRAQIRGIVTSWRTFSLTVSAAGETLDIAVPSEVYLRCMSETVTGPDGEVVETSSVFLDFRNAQSKGTLVERSVVQEKIPQGDELTLIVNVDSNENMTADMFVGYGCEVN